MNSQPPILPSLPEGQTEHSTHTTVVEVPAAEQAQNGNGNRPLKDWPADAIVIVCALPQEFRHDLIGGDPQARVCSDCEAIVLADSWTIRRAEAIPIRRGRPLRFLCLQCAAGYDYDQVQYSERHRKGRAMLLKNRGPQE